MNSIVMTDWLMTASPMLWVMLGAMVIMIVDLFLKPSQKWIVILISYVALVLAGISCGGLWGGHSDPAFGGIIVADNFSVIFQFILVVTAAVAVALSEEYVKIKGINHGEYYALLLFSTSGAMLMAASRELITIFIGLEVLSIALYILAGFARTEARSEESAMKYFLLGAFSSGFFLYGIALIYGASGMAGPGYSATTILPDLANYPPAVFQTPYAMAGIALLIVGLAFKAAIVPFHQWTPDVYEGSPTSVTAFMSVAAKAGAYAAFIRVAAAFLHVAHYFHTTLYVLAILTMIVGNVLAVQQNNIKRMLAYSSIAHAGYILVGLLAQNAEGWAGIIFYVLAYLFMNLGAFGVLILLARRGEEVTTFDDIRGLGRRLPAVAALMAVFMLSLGGIPPTAGFMGKWFLFFAAVHAGMPGLAVVGLLASVVGVFYYLRVILAMYFEAPSREFVGWKAAPGAAVAVVVCAFFSVVLGVYPNSMYPATLSGAQSINEGQKAKNTGSPGPGRVGPGSSGPAQGAGQADGQGPG